MGLETPQKKMDTYLMHHCFSRNICPSILFWGVTLYIYIYIATQKKYHFIVRSQLTSTEAWKNGGGQIHRPNSNFGHEPIWDCLIVKNGAIIMPIRLKMQTFIQQLWISGEFAGDYDGLCLMIHHLLPFNHHLSAISVVPGDSRSENPEGNDNL